MAATVDTINLCEFYVLIAFPYLQNGLLSNTEECEWRKAIKTMADRIRAVLNFIFGVLGLSIGHRDTIGGLLNRKIQTGPKAFCLFKEGIREFSNCLYYQSLI